MRGKRLKVLQRSSAFSYLLKKWFLGDKPPDDALGIITEGYRKSAFEPVDDSHTVITPLTQVWFSYCILIKYFQKQETAYLKCGESKTLNEVHGASGRAI